ncbi:MAG TPA: carbon-nitrogen hydrolase family protein [Intrasporangium sp.]|uniref:carbon-nitrogen hydrolase family protein n=1 Tax=Intrasporangium sp. TaxID=1925024 RepID=UPI002D7667A9|nr:carbon-nitrogen hydrolase family protein [Intrasporangium sp.]HET7397354.1 carbon-nitrogen hydrolase family protein [Intrasporangium sp.]
MTGESARLVQVAVVQQVRPVGDAAGNREHLARLVEEHRDADLVVFPEMYVTGYDLAVLAGRSADLAEHATTGPTALLVRGLSMRHQLTIVVGFLERGDGGKPYDSLLIAAPGGLLSAYRKSHLFPAELPVFAPGHELPVIPTPAGVLGPQICFEHAFPAISTTQALAGAQILVIPSAVGADHEHLIEVRTRARAQDNQVFAIAANSNSPGFCGHSMVVDPRGRILAAAGHEDVVLRTTLDLSHIPAERRREPSLGMGRPDLYLLGHREIDE